MQLLDLGGLSGGVRTAFRWKSMVVRKEWDKAEEEIHRRQETGEVKAYASTLAHSRQKYDDIQR